MPSADDGRAERERAASTARLERLLSLAAEGLWEYDWDSGDFSCNPRLLVQLGLSPQGDSTPRQLLRQLDGNARHRVLLALRTLIQDGAEIEELFSVRPPGQERQWRRLCARRLAGRLIGGSVDDVTTEILAAREHMRYQALMDGVVASFPIPVSVKDESGCVLLANEAFCRLLGMRAGEANGKQALAIMPSDIATRFNALDRLAFETGSQQTMEGWFEFEAGAGRRFLHITKTRSIDRSGRQVVVSVYEDLTRLREYAERMRELSMNVENFAQGLLSTLPNPVYVKDADSRYLMANEAFADQTGLDLAEIIGRTSTELFGSALGGPMEEEDQRVFAGERVAKEDSIRNLRTGQVRRWRVSKGLCRDIGGRPAILGSNFEITERFRTELELRAALQQQTELYRFLQQAFDAMPDPVFVKDAAHRNLMGNRALAELLGVDAKSIAGRRAADHFPAPLAGLIEDVENEALAAAGAPVTSRLFELAGHDGANRHMRLVCRSCRGGEDAALVVGVLVDLTRSVEHEARLQRMNRFMQDVFDAIPNPIAVKNRQHVYVMANRALAEAHGMSVEQIIGSSTHDFNPPGLAEETVRADDELFDADVGVTTTCEIPQWYADRQEHRILLRKVVCRDPDGNPLIIASNSDVTALRAKESELTLSLERQIRMREFLFSVLDLLPFGTYVKEESLNYVMCNQVHARFMGLVPASITGHRVGDFLSPDCAERIESLERALLAKPDGEVSELEMQVMDHGGDLRHLRLYRKTARDLAGRRVIIGVEQDLTPLREAELRLRGTLGRLDDLVRNAPFGIGRCDEHGRFVELNPLLRRLLGEPGELVAVPPLQALLCEDGAAALSGASVVGPIACQLRVPTGGSLPVLFSAVPLPARETGDGGCWVLFVDQREAQAAQAELRRHRDQLSELVAEQTLDIRHAKDAAEKANAAKSDFLAHVSHELRTPLHAMLGFARLGEERYRSLSPERLRYYFGRVAESGGSLLDLLDALLDLSKLEAGKLSLQISSHSLSGILDEVAREFEGLFATRRLVLATDYDDSVVSVAVDAVRIGQVVRNLISNAAKFAPAESCITISTRRAGKDGAGFSVSDEGPGIPASELDVVFDKFAQSSRTRIGGGGTGLGLTICREIIAAHGGQIHARNREEGGCEIVVTLPLNDDCLPSGDI